MTAPEPLVRAARSGAVTTLVLDSPGNRNSLSKRLVDELSTLLVRADADPDTRVVVIDSSTRVFCSGLDLAEAIETGMTAAARRLLALQRTILSMSTPVVAVLRGPVRAGGLAIVCTADVVIAGRSADVKLTEVRLAVAPAVISLGLLAHLPRRVVADLCLTARAMSADEAAGAGLVTCVVDDDDVDQEMASTTAEITRGEPDGMRATKALLNRDLIAMLDTRGDALAEESATLFASDRARELIGKYIGR